MVVRRKQAILLATLTVLAASALFTAGSGHANGAGGAVQNPVWQAATPAAAQPSPTKGALVSEVLPPVVSLPPTTGRGLFDEITDRLLKSLLNF